MKEYVIGQNYWYSECGEHLEVTVLKHELDDDGKGESFIVNYSCLKAEASKLLKQ